MTFDLAEMMSLAPYSLDAATKAPLFRAGIDALTRHHYQNCVAYKNICDGLRFNIGGAVTIEDYPFLPARLFKYHELKSMPDAEIQRVLTSSGTSGKASKIYLDAITAAGQTKALSKIVSDYLGPQRLPMLVIDSPGSVKTKGQLSARTAGIVGYSIFGRDVTYALRDDMSIDIPVIEDFYARHVGAKFFIFGFTFVVFLHFIRALEILNENLPLGKGILIHGGGWKKLADIAVDNPTFKRRLKSVSGIDRVHNYYGLVEQTGSVFVECEYGHIHCSNLSDVVIRGSDLSVAPKGKKGMIQVMSLLPHGYPGHILLTEDEGTMLGEDDCACGRKGKYFTIHGRISQAEVRGCSDAYVSR